MENKPEVWQVGVYKLFQYAGGYTFRGKPVKAMIQLSEDGGSRHVFTYFTTHPPEVVQKTEDNILAWFAYDQFPAMVDMLRNEKPIFVHFLETPKINYLNVTTAEEPVGEGE